MWKAIVLSIVISCMVWKTGYIDISLEQMEFAAAAVTWVLYQMKTIGQK